MPRAADMSCGRRRYVDAPIQAGVEYLADIRSMKEYAFLLRPDGDVTFWAADDAQVLGRTNIDEIRAESVNVKRMLEAREGNLESFARGFSYVE